MVNKKYIKIILFFIILCAIVYAQTHLYYSAKTAHLLPKKSIEIGIFQPLRYSYSNKTEFSLHPLMFLLAPNLQIKKAHKPILGLHFSSQHNIYYPTLFLKVIAREGTGGIIAKEFRDDIPHMVSFYNGVLLTKKIRNNLLTLKTGFKFAVNSNNLDSRTSIDLPLAYPRLQVFHEGNGLQYGIIITSHIWKKFYVETNIELFHFPGSDENFTFEASNFFSWQKSKS